MVYEIDGYKAQCAIEALESAIDATGVTSTTFSPTLGIYKNLPNSVYHKTKGIGSTSLKALIERSPLHYIEGCIYPVQKQVFDFGNAVHALLQHRDGTFGDEIAVAPAAMASRRGKVAQEWFADARAHDKIPILHEESLRARDAFEAVMAHPTARRYLEGDGYSEHSWFRVDNGTNRLVKCRPDYDRPDIDTVVDFKTTRDASRFDQDVGKLGYDLSAAHYLGITERKFWLWIAVESERPHGVRVIQASQLTLEVGAAKLRHALAMWDHCLSTNDFPGYPEDVSLHKPSGWDVREWLTPFDDDFGTVNEPRLL